MCLSWLGPISVKLRKPYELFSYLRAGRGRVISIYLSLEDAKIVVAILWEVAVVGIETKSDFVMASICIVSISPLNCKPIIFFSWELTWEAKIKGMASVMWNRIMRPCRGIMGTCVKQGPTWQKRVTQRRKRVMTIEMQPWTWGDMSPNSSISTYYYRCT